MSRFLLVAVAAIAIIAAITNPKKEDHRDVLKRLITSKVIDNSADESSSQTNLEVAGSAIAMTLGMKAIDVMLESIVSVDSYVFFQFDTRHLSRRLKNNWHWRFRQCLDFL